MLPVMTTFLPSVAMQHTGTGGTYQRWSRGHKVRGQGQGHKKNPRPRPRTAFPRTDTLEAKAKDTGASALQTTKKKRPQKIFFRRSPIHRRTQNF